MFTVLPIANALMPVAVPRPVSSIAKAPVFWMMMGASAIGENPRGITCNVHREVAAVLDADGIVAAIGIRANPETINAGHRKVAAVHDTYGTVAANKTD
jgi:hypothetical protein